MTEKIKLNSAQVGESLRKSVKEHPGWGLGIVSVINYIGAYKINYPGFNPNHIEHALLVTLLGVSESMEASEVRGA